MAKGFFNQRNGIEINDTGTAIQYATEKFLNNLRPNMKIVKIRAELMKEIRSVFLQHNIIADKGAKWKVPETIPNPAVAEVLLELKTFRKISATGKMDDAFLVVYQEEEGLYTDKYDVISEIIRWIKYNASTRDIVEIITILRDKATLIELTKDRDLIAVNNGIFDYKSKILIPFHPKYVFLAKCRVNYIQNAPMPTIRTPDGDDWDPLNWFISLSDDYEIVELLWQIVGATIRPNVAWDRLVCFYSQKGMNGKGTLCELMKQLCGEGSYASIPISGFDKDYYLAQLLTATAIITDENGTAEYTKNAEKMKAIVTGDSFSINRKYKEAITFSFRGLCCECINSLPKISDVTDSLYRRFLIVPFDKTFKGMERKYIKEDYLHRRDVLEFVLWKVLNTDYYEFIEPSACLELLTDYKQFNDSTRAFVDEVFPEFVWSLIPQKFLYQLYLSWMKLNNGSATPLGKITFNEKVRNIIETEYSDEWIFRGDNVRVTKTNMYGPEPMIAEYNLTDWMSKTYKGNDIDKLCVPALSASYAGFERRQQVAQIVNDDSDE